MSKKKIKSNAVVKRIKYKSKYEELVAKDLIKNKIGFDYEGKVLEYYVKRKYHLDFLLENDVMIESKGYFKGSDRTKHLRLKELHKGLDIRFLFQADNKLSKTSKTRYSDWCLTNGFTYAISKTGEIPKDWLKKGKKNE